jgi:hypothetical protein
MAKYAVIENNEISELYDVLPDSWRNISGLSASENDIEFLKSLGWYPVVEQKVEYNPETHTLSAPEYHLDGDTVVQSYTVVEKDPLDPVLEAAEFMRLLRLIRDQKLAETDWTQLKDIPDSVSSKYSDYRQKLRDLPQICAQNGFTSMSQVTWPVPEL